jgi:tripartite-type tricarboxylate transporter receptor subunit TctC
VANSHVVARFPSLRRHRDDGAVRPVSLNASLRQLAAWFTAAMQASEVKPKLLNLGLYAVGTCGADFAEHIRERSVEYGRIIREANIKPE